MSLVLLMSLIVGASVLVSLLLVMLIRTRRGHDRPFMPGAEDVEGPYIGVLGTLYGILLAFMIFVVWTRFDAAQQGVDDEADTLGNVFRIAIALPEPYQSRLTTHCQAYAASVIHDEWPAMRHGKASQRTWAIVNTMWREIAVLEERQVGTEVVRDHLLAQYIRLTAIRRERLLRAQIGIPGILWAMLIFGGLLTLGFAVVFTSDRFLPHAIKSGMLAAIISFMLLVTWSLDHPFDGMVRVPPDAFMLQQELFRQQGRLETTSPCPTVLCTKTAGWMLPTESICRIYAGEERKRRTPWM